MRNKGKYISYLSQLQDGDILFTRGSSPLARMIRLFDGGRFNHCGIIYRAADGTPMVFEALGLGPTPTKLATRVSENLDFTVYRPGKPDYLKHTALVKTINARTGAKYDVWLLPKIAASRMLNRFLFTRNWFVSDNMAGKDICSETVRFYTDALGLTEYSAASMKLETGKEWITPNGILKYNKGNLKEVI